MAILVEELRVELSFCMSSVFLNKHSFTTCKYPMDSGLVGGNPIFTCPVLSKPEELICTVLESQLVQDHSICVYISFGSGSLMILFDLSQNARLSCSVLKVITGPCCIFLNNLITPQKNQHDQLENHLINRPLLEIRIVMVGIFQLSFVNSGWKISQDHSDDPIWWLNDRMPCELLISQVWWREFLCEICENLMVFTCFVGLGRLVVWIPGILENERDWDS